MEFLKAYIKHRAKAFVGFLVPALTTALITTVEQTFDFQLGTETETLIIGMATSMSVYKVSNGPKEGA